MQSVLVQPKASGKDSVRNDIQIWNEITPPLAWVANLQDGASLKTLLKAKQDIEALSGINSN